MAAHGALVVRPASPGDATVMRQLYREAVDEGTTLVDGPFVDEAATIAQWLDPSVRSFVATIGDDIVGMCKTGANRPDRGAHVATATFIVRASHRGQGVGARLVEHALARARQAGFAAMQFNFVVSSNTGAIALYRRLGFEIVGTLPRAFRHASLGLIDAYVMFQTFDRAS